MQFNSIQMLRFTAALLVVASHTTLEIWRRFLNDGQYGYWHVIGGAGVDIFFVISGFVMTISTTKNTSISNGPAVSKLFLKRRIIRIVPMYWFYSGLKVLIIVTAGSKAFKSGIDPTFVLASLFFLPAMNPAGDILPVLESGWTLNFEMLFYTTFAIALYYRFPKLSFCLLSFIGIYCLGYWYKGYIFFDFFSRSIIFEFLFGIVIARLWLNKITLHPTLPPFMVMTALFMIFAAPWSNSIDRIITDGMAAALLIFGLVWMEQYVWLSRIAGRFRLLGDASYSIYLSHGFLVPLAVIISLKLGIQNLPLIFSLALIVAVVGGCLLYLMIELPVTRGLTARFVTKRPEITLIKRL